MCQIRRSHYVASQQYWVFHYVPLCHIRARRLQKKTALFAIPDLKAVPTAMIATIPIPACTNAFPDVKIGNFFFEV
jgi:hypothetical protein